jgi:hypothetical protein
MSNPLMWADPLGLFTMSIGVDFSAALGLRVGASGQFVIDDKGNVGIILAVDGGAGTPAAAINGVITMTNANNIFELNGISVAMGASAAFGLPVALGLEGIVATTPSGATMMGVMVSVGLATPWPEIHTHVSYGRVLSLNWLPRFMKNLIVNSVNAVFDSLSDEQKNAMNEFINSDFFAPSSPSIPPSPQPGPVRTLSNNAIPLNNGSILPNVITSNHILSLIGMPINIT